MPSSTYTVKYIKAERRTVVTRSRGRENYGELIFNGYRVSFWDNEKVLECDGCTTMLLHYPLKIY